MLYNTIMSVNHRMIMGEEIPDNEKKSVIDLILNRCGQNQQEIEYLKGRSDSIYPHFLVPTDEEKNTERIKKPRLITGELPKTLILAYNAYELEALRLLSLWGSGDKKVENILFQTVNRLDKTCFGHFCQAGECTGASIAFLRFWTVYKPDDIERIDGIIARFSQYRDGKGLWRNGIDAPNLYFWFTLTGCNTPMALNEIKYSSEFLFTLLKKNWDDNKINQIRKYIIRNALARLPEYRYLANIEIYLGNDKRWHVKI